MLSFVNSTIKKLFGTKSERDIKELLPYVEAIKAEFSKLSSISDDELRHQTRHFKLEISAALAEVDGQISSIRQKVQHLPIEQQDEKIALFDQIDALTKKRDQELEKKLLEMLPRAFAVVKETARRYSENGHLNVSATEYDRNYAAQKSNVTIEGDRAIWSNTWLAAGTEVVWNMVHYDVQLIGGIVLHQGKIAEMATGEGKTLVSTLPSYLNALSGQGVHVVTVNDYLARRDSEWNGPLFEFHGLTVDCIDKHQPNTARRREAYLADICYGTNNEFGFDYLRDNMATHPDELVQRKHHFAMVDEVDSVLIDEARTPLIISGPVPKGGDGESFMQLKPFVEKLMAEQRAKVTSLLAEAKKMHEAGQEKDFGFPLLRAYRGLPKNKPLIKFLSEPGIRTVLQKVEATYMQDQGKEMKKVDAELYFVIDEKHNSVELTEKGIGLLADVTGDGSLFLLPNIGLEVANIEKMEGTAEEKANAKDALLQDYGTKADRVHVLHQLLKAYTLFEKDVEYIVDDNKVKIVDEQTGRVLDGRRYSDGLHQAIEAKENVKVEAATQTFATVTLQNYFRMYHKLCGMTGTAETEAGEFWQIYQLDVVTIPTNRGISRKDLDDLVYKTAREKYNAVIIEIERLVADGRPVLVGTTSVEISELLSRMLQMRKIKHNVLNAKKHQQEAEIVAEAGQPGAVTIATNMAGRGTDIKLGAGVKESGGLAIIGTERHESRRVDRQLRGRAGRQGDPGSSQFFVSLEDNLMRLFGSERIAATMDRFGYKEGEVIQHSLISRSIERAQKKVEENNFGTRKRLLEYDDVMNAQREVIYKRRRNALFGERLQIDIADLFADQTYHLANEFAGGTNYDGFILEVIRQFGIETSISAPDLRIGKSNDLGERLFLEVYRHYQDKSQRLMHAVHPFMESIHAERGEQIENVVVPMQTGNRGIQIPVNLEEAIETGSANLIRDFEKSVVLGMIDEKWMKHLRDMDDLKSSVQNVVYEQKDPLLIYKLEAYDLFSDMVNQLRSDIIQLLSKAQIPQNDGPDDAPQPPRKPAQRPAQQTYTSSSTSQVTGPLPTPPAAPRTQPVIAGPRIGRNDACPCGSGKKFKHCHGKLMEE
jgi:preprotein translocase subunit SecA